MLERTRLAGRSLQMSFAANLTGKLWEELMPLRFQLREIAGPELYSVEIYPDAGFFKHFNPHRNFEKWAAVSVPVETEFPASLQELIIPAGKYAVFLYRGKSTEAASFYQSIFQEWIPAAGYQLDDRPHMALMGDKYRNNDAASEEEIWIPVR